MLYVAFLAAIMLAAALRAELTARRRQRDAEEAERRRLPQARVVNR